MNSNMQSFTDGQERTPDGTMMNHVVNPSLDREFCQQIQDGVDDASADLYRMVTLLSRGAAQKASSWGADAEDLLHDIYVAVLLAIRKGAVRHPERLRGYIASTAQKQVASSLRTHARRRHQELEEWSPQAAVKPDTEKALTKGETLAQMKSLLRALPKIDQSILNRFYVLEQPWQAIAKELHLSPTQFRLRKHRALARMRVLAGGLHRAA
ncbi:MAG: sigma-70 family RNA polymerase sigma factor [Bryobacterales bacterium]|nr:sigma-70 family RNA polymerase sigma factor [Bryobacterales bacterium]